MSYTALVYGLNLEDGRGPNKENTLTTWKKDVNIYTAVVPGFRGVHRGTQ